MRLLVGARPTDEALAVLDALLPGDAVRAELVRAGLRGAAAALLTAASEVTVDRLATLGTRAAAVRAGVGVAAEADPVVDAAALAEELLSHHPGDPGVAVALLLRPVDLEPGAAVFVPAGLPHAYLAGLGVEVMRSSDNVVRGGLTTKHVDVDALVRLLDPAPRDAAVPAEVAGGWRRHLAPTEAFTLHEAELDGALDGALTLPEAGGPRIVLCAGGSVVVEADGAAVALAPGAAAYVVPAVPGAFVRGEGLVLVAS
jgi:mannose-6-phosphate isomerase